MAAEKRSTAGKHTCPKRRSLPAAEGIPTLSRERAQQSKTAKAALPMAQKISRKYCASSQLQSLFDEFTLAQRKGKIKGPGNCLFRAGDLLRKKWNYCRYAAIFS
jgi:hypothetical protein